MQVEAICQTRTTLLGSHQVCEDIRCQSNSVRGCTVGTGSGLAEERFPSTMGWIAEAFGSCWCARRKGKRVVSFSGGSAAVCRQKNWSKELGSAILCLEYRAYCKYSGPRINKNRKMFGFSSHLSGGSCFIPSTERAQVPVNEEVPFLSVHVSENQSAAAQCYWTREDFGHQLPNSQSSYSPAVFFYLL